MKYAGLSIDSIIMHQIVKKSSGVGAAILSEAPAGLDAQNKAYIQERIRSSLAKAERPIKEDSGMSPVPDQIRAHFQSSARDLVVVSQRLANRLQDCQHPVSPGGIFVFATSTLDKVDALLIAKLEHENGVRAQQSLNKQGLKTFSVELLHDLLFTTGSRVFKVALFVSHNRNSPLEGMLADNQIGGSSVAQYFLSEFLGCKLSERPEVLTERFLLAAHQWINKSDDAEKKGRYTVALLSELQSNSPKLSTNDFASRHLDINDRDDFANDMFGTGVPRRQFTKDTKLVASRIRSLRVDTKSGVMVVAPPEALENGVMTISDNEADEKSQSTIVIVDELSGFSGRGSVKRD